MSSLSLCLIDAFRRAVRAGAVLLMKWNVAYLHGRGEQLDDESVWRETRLGVKIVVDEASRLTRNG